MDWLSRLFRAVPKEEREGISLNRDTSWWRLDNVRNFPNFLRCLPKIFPEGSVLYLEGTYARDVKKFLNSRRIPNTARVAIGTIWPRPSIFHIPLTPENVLGLAALAERRNRLEICQHLHVYKEENVLLESHDCMDNFADVSGVIAETYIKAFYAEVGCSYKKEGVK